MRATGSSVTETLVPTSVRWGVAVSDLAAWSADVFGERGCVEAFDLGPELTQVGLLEI